MSHQIIENSIPDWETQIYYISILDRGFCSYLEFTIVVDILETSK